MNYCVPIYAIIDATDDADAARAKAAIENLLKNDMVRMTLMSAGVRVRDTEIKDAYLMQQQPGMQQQPQYPQQPQYGGNNGRR